VKNQYIVESAAVDNHLGGWAVAIICAETIENSLLRYQVKYGLLHLRFGSCNDS
jgi:hypothetical protein